MRCAVSAYDHITGIPPRQTGAAISRAQHRGAALALAHVLIHPARVTYAQIDIAVGVDPAPVA